MIFRSNKHFSVQFGGVHVAGKEKIAADVSDTEVTNRLVHHHDQPVQPVQISTNRFVVLSIGSSSMWRGATDQETNRSVGEHHQPVHRAHQPVGGTYQSVHQKRFTKHIHQETIQPVHETHQPVQSSTNRLVTLSIGSSGRNGSQDISIRRPINRFMELTNRFKVSPTGW